MSWSGRAALLGAGVVLVAAAGLGARALSGSGPGAIDEPLTVQRGDLVLNVEARGELSAVRATDIGPPLVKDYWDYKISFLAPESSEVKAGDPVVGFDTQQLQRTLEEKKAELAESEKQIERREIDMKLAIEDQELALAEAEGRLKKARLKVEIPEDLKEGIEAREALLDMQAAESETRNLTAKLESIRAAGEAELRALTGRRDRARARITELETAIDAMTVRAPQAGIVIYKSDWNDEKKKVGDSAWQGEKLVELPDLSEMKADAEVDEADGGRIAVGQKATIRLEAHPDADFTGRVSEIGRTVRRRGWRDPNKVYKVEIALDETDARKMRPGMRFRGDIETGRVPSLLLVPREAVFVRSEGPVVWVRRGRRYVEAPVELGRSNDRFFESLSGLEEGDLLSPVDLEPPEALPVGPSMAAAR